MILIDNIWTVNLWRRVKTPYLRDKWKIVETFVPTARGVPFSYIPFTIINAETLGPAVSSPPMLDLADVNLAHFRGSADIEHARHFVALPCPVLVGFQKSNEVRIGPGSALISEDTGARASYLEFQGTGLGALEKGQEEKVSMMATLGAKLLFTQEKRAVESADAYRLRASGDTNTLAGLSRNISRGLTIALRQVAQWAYLDPAEVHVAFNTDFLNEQLSPQAIQALLLLYQSGSISHDTFLFNLKRGELLQPGMDAKSEKLLIAAEIND